jgi:hypothetical protein
MLAELQDSWNKRMLREGERSRVSTAGRGDKTFSFLGRREVKSSRASLRRSSSIFCGQVTKGRIIRSERPCDGPNL